MKRAILSDIHGNLEALNAVMDDLKQQGCEQIVCLGDIVGYGPDPKACLDAASRFDVCILGNHDLAALFDPEGFSNSAEKAILWTRQQMEQGDTADECLRRLSFLSHMPRTRREGDVMFVHGSVRNPINEYVFPEDVYNQRKMERLFSMLHKLCFQGHTHVPGIFTSDLRFLRPTDIGAGYGISDKSQQLMINVGSVGQPRDADPRSCYVIMDDQSIEFRRVEYDIEATVRMIEAEQDLDNFLGYRLRDGR